jgi:hypothetical protein
LLLFFNSVNHEILLSKLQFYGIGGKFHDLSNRYQRVLIASADLSYVSISPFSVRSFFLFCVNDLPTIFNNSIKSVLFADDASLDICCDDNIQYRDEVNCSFAHMSSNSLSLKFNKTKHVQFVTKFSSNSETLVSYHNNVILSSSSVEFLGIVIENSCT